MASSLPEGRPAETALDRRMHRMSTPFLVELLSQPFAKGNTFYARVAGEDGIYRGEMPFVGSHTERPEYTVPTQVGEDSPPTRVYALAVNYGGKGSMQSIIIGVVGVLADAFSGVVTTHGRATSDVDNDIGVRAILPYMHETDRSLSNEGKQVMSRYIVRGSIKHTKGENPYSGDGDLMLWVSDIKPRDFNGRLSRFTRTDADSTTALYKKVELEESQSRLRVALVGDQVGFRIGAVQNVRSKQTDWTVSTGNTATHNHARGIPFDVSKDIFDGVFLPADERVPLGGALVQNYINATLCDYVGMLGKQVAAMSEAFERIGYILNDALGSSNDKAARANHNSTLNDLRASGFDPNKNNSFGYTHTLPLGNPVTTQGGLAQAPFVPQFNQSLGNQTDENAPAASKENGLAQATDFSFSTPKVQAVQYLYGVLWEISSAIGGFKPDGKNQSTVAGNITKVHESDAKYDSTLCEQLRANVEVWAEKLNRRAPRSEPDGTVTFSDTAVFDPSPITTLQGNKGRAYRMYVHPRYFQTCDIAESASGSNSTLQKLRTYVELPPYAWWEKCLSPLVHINPVSMDPQEYKSMESNTTPANKPFADRFWVTPRKAYGEITEKQLSDNAGLPSGDL